MRDASKNTVYLGLVALSSAAPVTIPSAHIAAIMWSTCPDTIPAGIECGQLDVPMDYSNPGGANITLAITRLPTNGTNKLGSLLLNPGGPGGPATSLIEYQALYEAVVSGDIREHYDLIGADPRGVGMSTPIICNATIGSQRVNPYPTDDVAFEELVAHNKALGASCANLTGPLINFVDTISAARDLDLIREALGEATLNWLGFSYGSQLGSQYAALFPNRIGRMVLDGCVSHSQDQVSTFMTESLSYESTLNQFFQWCNSTTSCAFHGHDLPTIFDSLIDQADQVPVAAPGCTGETGSCRTDATGYEILTNVQDSLAYQNSTVLASLQTWSSLSEALLAAVHGNATALSSRIGSATDYSGIAIGCQDWQRSPASYLEVKSKVLLGRTLSPHTRGVSQSLGYQTMCIGWPAPVSNPQQLLDPLGNLLGKQEVLLVNSFHDPQTSMAWALSLKDEMANSVAVYRDGSGHTSYVLGGETQAVIDEFLLEGTIPETGTVYAN